MAWPSVSRWAGKEQRGQGWWRWHKGAQSRTPSLPRPREDGERQKRAKICCTSSMSGRAQSVLTLEWSSAHIPLSVNGASVQPRLFDFKALSVSSSKPWWSPHNKGAETAPQRKQVEKTGWDSWMGLLLLSHQSALLVGGRVRMTFISSVVKL